MKFLNLSKKDWIYILSFFVLILIIYGQSLFGDFVFDDRNIIENKEMLSSVGNLGEVVMHPFWSKEAGLYRPLTLLSHKFNFIFLGGGAFGFHLVNILLYFISCSLVYIFIKRFFKNDYIALFSSLLFLILPIHTEVVANISGRNEILSLIFSLLVLLEFTAEKKINFWRVGLWVLFAIGSKETAVAIIPIIFVLLYIKEQRINKEIINKYFLSISSLFIGTFFYLFLRFFSLGPNSFLGVKTTLIENPLIFTDTLSRIVTSFKIFWMYIMKTFWPFNLCSDYSYNQIPIISNFFNLETILGFLVFSVSIILIFFYIKKKPIISFSLSIFIFSFILVSNILFPIGTIAGERLFFFPSLGLSILVVFILYKLYLKIKNKKLQIVIFSIFVIILSFYAFLSLKRQGIWMNEEKLFLSAGRCAPNSVLAKSNRGAIYLLKGNLDKAQEDLEYARSIKPIYSKGLNNLGLLYFYKGETEKAKELYFEALKQDFPYYGSIENIVLLYLSQNETEKAKHWLMFLYPKNEKEIDMFITNYLKENNK